MNISLTSEGVRTHLLPLPRGTSGRPKKNLSLARIGSTIDTKTTVGYHLPESKIRPKSAAGYARKLKNVKMKYRTNTQSKNLMMSLADGTTQAGSSQPLVRQSGSTMECKASSNLNSTMPAGRILSQDSRQGSRTGMKKKQELRFTRISNSKIRPQTALGSDIEKRLSIGSTVQTTTLPDREQKRGSVVIQGASSTITNLRIDAQSELGILSEPG